MYIKLILIYIIDYCHYYYLRLLLILLLLLYYCYFIIIVLVVLLLFFFIIIINMFNYLFKSCFFEKKIKIFIHIFLKRDHNKNKALQVFCISLAIIPHYCFLFIRSFCLII